jgi:hypothetical protein
MVFPLALVSEIGPRNRFTFTATGPPDVPSFYSLGYSRTAFNFGSSVNLAAAGFGALLAALPRKNLPPFLDDLLAFL